VIGSPQFVVVDKNLNMEYQFKQNVEWLSSNLKKERNELPTKANISSNCTLQVPIHCRNDSTSRVPLMHHFGADCSCFEFKFGTAAHPACGQTSWSPDSSLWLWILERPSGPFKSRLFAVFQFHLNSRATHVPHPKPYYYC
jgi:hypothetical protein